MVPFSPPVYAPPPPDPSEWGVFAAWVWNTVSGVVTAIVSGVTSFVSVVWSASTAAAAYIGGALESAGTLAAQGLATLGNQVASALEQVARAMIWALSQLLSAIIEGIRLLVTAAIDAATLVMNAAIRSEQSNLAGATSGAVWSYLTQRGAGTAPGNVTSMLEGYLLPFIVASTAITIVLAIVLGIALPFSIGIGVLVGLFIPLIRRSAIRLGLPAWDVDIRKRDCYLYSELPEHSQLSAGDSGRRTRVQRNGRTSQHDDCHSASRRSVSSREMGLGRFRRFPGRRRGRL